MEVVLVGLPGSGKSVIGRRLAHHHGAAFVDLDEEIERAAGASIPEIFAAEGEAGFRSRERDAVAALGPALRGSRVDRVIATGGGAIVDPRNRWTLYRGRLAVWIDASPTRLADRLKRSRHVRPLLVGSTDPVATLSKLRSARARFYAAATRIAGDRDPGAIRDDIDRLVRSFTGRADGGRLLDARIAIGRIEVGDGTTGSSLGNRLRTLGARRAILVSEPGAWGAVGESIAADLTSRSWALERVMLPEGEAAKRLEVIGSAATDLARIHAERGEPLVAIGGGALGDTAGFLAAVWLRGVPVIQVPTTLVAQLDSAIGGKTAVDLPEGKNLVGAIRQPAAIVIDVAHLRTLPSSQLRAALGEAMKMGLLGDERLLELLEERGQAIADGSAEAFEDGTVAELVERCAWAKVETVLADERETGDARIRLNLGHTVGHAIEAADGYSTIRHGEAVAYGLRAACRIGAAIGTTPAERAARAEALLDALELGVEPLPYPPAAIREAIEVDKKHRDGRQRWVLPTATGSEIRDDIPEAVVAEVLEDVIAGRRIASRGLGR